MSEPTIEQSYALVRRLKKCYKRLKQMQDVCATYGDGMPADLCKVTDRAITTLEIELSLDFPKDTNICENCAGLGMRPTVHEYAYGEKRVSPQIDSFCNCPDSPAYEKDVLEFDTCQFHTLISEE